MARCGSPLSAVTIVAVSRSEDTEPIYAMHARWLTEVLGPGDSLFTPGVPVWTQENLDELERAFVAHPDTTPGRRYEDKLRDQIAGVSPAAKQLMAELHAVHFLMIWTGAISVTTKTNILKAILAWMPAPPDIPDDVVRAMGPGLVNPGTWVMTRRDTQTRSPRTATPGTRTTTRSSPTPEHSTSRRAC
jgi:hypothetical protein